MRSAMRGSAVGKRARIEIHSENQLIAREGEVNLWERGSRRV